MIREAIAPTMTQSERLTDEQLGTALANAVERLTGDEADRERWCAGDAPSLPKLAAEIGVKLETLCDVFAEEIFKSTGSIIGPRGRLQ